MSKFKRKKIKRKPKKLEGKIIISIPESSKTNILRGKPDIIFICKVYNISTNTLIDFLNQEGYTNIKLNSLVDKHTLNLIDKKFLPEKIEKDKVRGKTNVEYIDLKSNTLPQVKKGGIIIEKQEIYREPVLHIKGNQFNSIKTLIKFKDYPEFESKFSDLEAINICRKMSSSYTRNLCKQLNKPNCNRSLIIYQLHHIANKALRIFGGKILTFIYGLRDLQFKNQTADEIRTYKKVIPDFPILSFQRDNTGFKISFFVKQRNYGGGLKADIRLYAARTYEQIGFIDEEGYVLSKLIKFKPHLTLFYQVTKNNNYRLYSGVETGYCDICGRELNHPVSLRVGVGPTCAERIGINYHFI